MCDFVVPGPLKLKGKSKHRTKKEKKKLQEAAAKEIQRELDASEKKEEEEVKEAEEATPDFKKLDPEKQKELEKLIPLASTMTKAQLKFAVHKTMLEKEQIKKEAATTYREKVTKLNQSLDKIPEHNDIPRIGPG